MRWQLAGLLVCTGLVAGCARPSSVAPSSTASAAPPAGLAAVREGDCLVGLAGVGAAAGQAVHGVDCASRQWDARVLGIMRDGTYNCPSGTNLFKAVQSGAPTYRSIVLCLQTR